MRVSSVILVQVILDVAAIIGFCSILEPLWSIKEFLVSLQSLQLCVRGRVLVQGLCNETSVYEG